MTIKLNTQDVRMLATFQHVTGVNAVDCFIKDGSAYFFVEEDKMSAAIGKGGSSVKTLRHLLGKPVWLIGWYPDVQDMLKSLIPQVRNVETNNGDITISISHQDKRDVIGTAGRNIKILREILKRQFKINNLNINYNLDNQVE